MLGAQCEVRKRSSAQCLVRKSSARCSGIKPEVAGAKGKSGGVRVIYYWVRADDQIFLLTIYGKNEKADLSAADLKRVVRLLEELTNG